MKLNPSYLNHKKTLIIITLCFVVFAFTAKTVYAVLTLNSTNITSSGTLSLTPGTWTLTLPTSAGTAGQYLQTNGSGVTTWVTGSGGSLAIGNPVTSGTAGSIPYINSSGNLAQDNSNLFWDGTNHRIGIGTTAPSQLLSVGNNNQFTVSSTGDVDIQQRIFYDNFNRPNQSGLGTAPNGQTYFTTGAGVATLQILNNAYTGSGVIYAGILAPSMTTRVGGTFSFNSPGGGVLALVSSSDSSILLQHMLHLVIGRNGVTLSWWLGASQNNIISCRGPGFPSSLADGTVYSVYMNINIAANTVHIVDPFGQSIDCSDSHISQVAGNLTIWEITDTGLKDNWNSVEQYALTTQNNYGVVNATNGFQGALGNITPSSVFANSLSIGTTNTIVPLDLVNNAGTDAFRITSSVDGATMRIKTTGSGFIPAIWLDQGQTNPTKIYSSGNANDLRLNVNATDRLVMPSSGGVAAYFLNGNVGIGLTNPTTDKLVVFGDIRVGAAGTDGCIKNFAGTPLTGSCVSDNRLKTNISPINGILDNFIKLNPVTYQWRVNEFPERGFGSTSVKGLIAQDVEQVFPELVGTDNQGFKTVDYGVALQMLSIEAIKELNLKIDLAALSMPIAGSSTDGFFINLFSRVGAWFGDAGNGIGDFFANRVRTKELCISDAGGETCITRAKLNVLIAGAERNTVVTSPTPDPTPILTPEPEPIENVETIPEIPPVSPPADETEAASAPDLPDTGSTSLPNTGFSSSATSDTTILFGILILDAVLLVVLLNRKVFR